MGSDRRAKNPLPLGIGSVNPALCEIERKCNLYGLEFEQELRFLVELIKKDPSLQHPKFKTETLLDGLLRFKEHLYSRGDSFQNWSDQLFFLYLKPKVAGMFRRGGMPDRPQDLAGYKLSLKYFELSNVL